MKITIIQEEGLNFTADHYFGDTKDSLGDYYPFLKYELSHYILDNFFHLMSYSITQDGFLQITVDYQGYDYDDGHLKEPNGNPVIVAQYKRNESELKSQLLEIIEKYFDSFPFYLGYSPYKFVDGTIVDEKEFIALLQSLRDKSNANTKEAIKANRPSFADVMDTYNLNPTPYREDTITWLAVCPRCRKHLLRFRFGEQEWGCGYCGFNGKSEQEFSIKVSSLEEKRRFDEERKNMKPLDRKLTTEELIQLLM